MVLLLHTLADGASHYDWLLERPGVPEGMLAGFRTLERVDDRGTRGFRAERMGDHRRVYLEYEGEISGGRGHVRRVASGTVHEMTEGAGAIGIVVSWDGGEERVVWMGTAEETWRFLRGG